ncbi:sulfatase-like hydrolase/transferase [Haloarcula laminariae]|uniref:sulfatase-like hydrolase/transferase n=1 Tax=Haloarcula laminariae TaxID=2961577 RepID=UPI0032B00A62
MVSIHIERYRVLPEQRRFRRIDTARLPSQTGRERRSRAVREWVGDTSWGDDEFLFLNVMESHAPYSPPAAYRIVEVGSGFNSILAAVTDTAVETDVHRQAYHDSVRYLADIHQDIFELLAGDFDYVFTLGDHGELLGEYGEWTHFHGPYPELTNIPLSVYAGTDADESVDVPVSLLDVPATVADFAGVDYPSRGVSLLSDPAGRLLLTESHRLTETVREKLRRLNIPERRRAKLDGHRRGLALPPSYYGYETDDGFTEGGESDTADPQSALSTLVEDLDERRVDEDTEGVPESVRQQLSDLGYA